MFDVSSRQQIHDALLSYCRGIDRLDAGAVSAAFHPGAQLEGYAPTVMSIETFVEHALASLGAKFTATQHRISNTRIEETDGGARVETYVLASHVQTSDGGDRLLTFAGRYIDRATERDGQWRIEHRTLRHDWSKIEEIAEPMTGAWVQSGRAGTPDPLDD
ncbi:MAG: nuclear transport factor 2 family protein [Ilumatobacter sp.]|jgi:hypothetical protein|uniref:nuclear transport factor 2 family protein n=1 Tax=Ilumatobacter sp. TaxID=1967498 RepID=UPI00391B0E89